MKTYQIQWQKLSITDLYQTSKSKFFRFLSNYFHLNSAEIEDIYQESIFILIKNLNKKKSSERSCSPETFLFGIGKNLARMLKRKQIKERNISISRLTSLETVDEEKWDNRMHKVEELLCQEQYKILRLYYLKGLSIEEIKQKMNYKNRDTVKTMKCKKMKKLKTTLKVAVA